MISFIKAIIRALRDERVRARRKWAYRSRIVNQPPKVDPRSSIEMHKRIVGDTTPSILRRQAF